MCSPSSLVVLLMDRHLRQDTECHHLSWAQSDWRLLTSSEQLAKPGAHARDRGGRQRGGSDPRAGGARAPRAERQRRRRSPRRQIDVLSGKRPGTAPRAPFVARVTCPVRGITTTTVPRTCSSAGARHDGNHHLADSRYAVRAWPVEVLVLARSCTVTPLCQGE